MSMLSDFKKFAFRGNVLDLATGVIIGGAFGRIVSSLVADVMMPVVSLVLPGGAWRERGWVLRHAARPEDDVVLRWGEFMGSVLDFVVVALVLFLIVVKAARAAQASLASDAAGTTQRSTRACPQCLETVPTAARRCRACTSDLG